MKHFLIYLLALFVMLPMGGVTDVCAQTQKKATVKKSTKKSSAKKKAGAKKKPSAPKPVESFNYGSGEKVVLNVKSQVQRVVTRKKGRRIVTYKRVSQPLISLTYHGLDVSHHQHDIDWPSVAQHDIQFIYIKATEGEVFRDDMYETNVSRARAAGLKVGSYLYFHPEASAKRQFENFRDVVREEYQDLIPMVDVEETDGLNRRLVQNRLHELLDIMTDYYGQRPLIYTATSFYNTYLQNAINEYPLMMGGYTRKPVLLDGKDYCIWQFSSHGHVNGIEGNVDLDVFNTGHTIDDILFDQKKVRGVKLHRIPMKMPDAPTLPFTVPQPIHPNQLKPRPAESKFKMRAKALSANKKNVKTSVKNSGQAKPIVKPSPVKPTIPEESERPNINPVEE
ncbi:MAG: hypothetical protein MJZ23_02480 [Paludibacteraceae bacterium]|nr:hypothetical protein [Paludibacteraceae bacterium]